MPAFAMHIWSETPKTWTFLQIHHLLNLGAEINQRDDRGLTPLHRAAYLAHYDGYLEIYEYLLVRFPLRRSGHLLISAH